MTNISFSDLEPSDDYLLVLYKGKPFTGTAVEHNSKGVMISSCSYVEGKREGVSRVWSADGVLLREQELKGDAAHGLLREWHPSGELKTEAFYECAVCIRERSWNASGKLLRDFSLKETDPQFKTLQLLREKLGWY